MLPHLNNTAEQTAVACKTPQAVQLRLLQGQQETRRTELSVPEGLVSVPEGSVPVPEGSVPVPEGSVPVPEGLVPVPEGLVPVPEGLFVPEDSGSPVALSTRLELARLCPPLQSPLLESAQSSAAWHLATLGERLLELVATDGSASLSYAMALALEAQCAHEPVVWICQHEHGFSCADAEASGLDLSSMPVIRVDSAQNCGRVADKLLRSGAFALAIVELGAATLPAPLLARLGGLARRHNCTVLFLTERQKANSTLGSLISVRAESTRQRDGEYFSCRLQALKDRRCAPGWQLTQRFRGPAGL